MNIIVRTTKIRLLNQMEKTLKELRARVNLIIEKANRLSKKKYKGKEEGRLEGIFNIKDLCDQMNNEVKTSEESHKEDVDGEIDSGRDRRECISDCTKGTCVIWCERMKFWNLVVGTVGLRVTEIWGRSEVWKRQSRKWWAYTPWNNEEEGGSEL